MIVMFILYWWKGYSHRNLLLFYTCVLFNFYNYDFISIM